MVRIPPGSFTMGSNEDTTWSACYPCEQPVHEVTLPYAFYIGRCEVTQAQWQAVTGNSPPGGFGEGPNHPVYSVTWVEALAFIDELNTLGLGVFRLPTEAEWEYACRAGTVTRFFFGDSYCSPTATYYCDLNEYAWWRGSVYYYPYDRTQAVRGKLFNPWGLYDTAGNVWEMCEDDWHGSYDGAPADGSAWIESPRSFSRVIRGGSVTSGARECRSASRSTLQANTGYGNVGLRLVREVGE
jgi:formylglycine-generating enzyme required for sulfatase activity